MLAGRLEGLVLEFRAMAGEEDQLYGSVSIADIADRLEGSGFEIERSQIKLDQPIKSLGEFEVPAPPSSGDAVDSRARGAGRG